MNVGELRVAVDRFSGVRVLAIGDVMLDQYLWGAVRRISPEAPVPVVEVHERSTVPGGAANAAAGIVALGGSAILAGVVGSDPDGAALRSAIDRQGIDGSGVVSDASRPTTVKTRIIGGNQQVVRADVERSRPLDGDVRARLTAWARRELARVDVVIVSDYAKGVVTEELAREVFEAAAADGTPVIVDPKGLDFRKYKGATVLTPNVVEAARAAGLEVDGAEDVGAAARHLTAVLPGTALLITRGAEGMSLFIDGVEVEHIAAVAQEVYDVTGAGDSVVSALALSLAVGLQPAAAARLANEVAGLVVAKVGTATVSADELRERLNRLAGAAP